MAKRDTIQLSFPKGEFVYPWLNTPDSREFNGKPQKPNFNCTMKYLSTDPKWLAMKVEIDALVQASAAEARDNNPKVKSQVGPTAPYRNEVDAEGDDTGYVLVKAKQNAQITYSRGPKAGETVDVKIDLFDASMRPLPKAIKIYGGSTGRMTVGVRNYFVASSKAAGISLDLKAVQVLSLVTGTGRSGASFGFEAEEGFSVDDVEEEIVADTADVSAESDPTDF